MEVSKNMLTNKAITYQAVENVQINSLGVKLVVEAMPVLSACQNMHNIQVKEATSVANSVGDYTPIACTALRKQMLHVISAKKDIFRSLVIVYDPINYFIQPTYSLYNY